EQRTYQTGPFMNVEPSINCLCLHGLKFIGYAGSKIAPLLRIDRPVTHVVLLVGQVIQIGRNPYAFTVIEQTSVDQRIGRKIKHAGHAVVNHLISTGTVTSKTDTVIF